MSGSTGRHLQRSLGVGCKKPKSCPLQLTMTKTVRIVKQVWEKRFRGFTRRLIDELRCYWRLPGLYPQLLSFSQLIQRECLNPTVASVRKCIGHPPTLQLLRIRRVSARTPLVLRNQEQLVHSVANRKRFPWVALRVPPVFPSLGSR